MVKKTVDAKAKAGLHATFYIWKVDSYCPRGKCPVYVTVTKVQNQNFSFKNFCVKEPKELKTPSLKRSEQLEASEKKFWRKKKQCHFCPDIKKINLIWVNK